MIIIEIVVDSKFSGIIIYEIMNSIKDMRLTIAFLRKMVVKDVLYDHVCCSLAKEGITAKKIKIMVEACSIHYI